jgi:hypothetical protein
VFSGSCAGWLFAICGCDFCEARHGQHFRQTDNGKDLRQAFTESGAELGPKGLWPAFSLSLEVELLHSGPSAVARFECLRVFVEVQELH